MKIWVCKVPKVRYIRIINAWVAELADALDLGSSTERCEGSTPSSRIFKLDHVPVQHKFSHLIPLPYNISPVILNTIIWLELVPGSLSIHHVLSQTSSSHPGACKPHLVQANFSR